MADPFALMNRTLDRNKGRAQAGRRKVRDVNNPKDVEYLRRMHPDFDEVMGRADVDYRTRSQTDANFASKFQIPPILEASQVIREHTNSVDCVCWGPEPGVFVSASHDSTIKVWSSKTGKSLETLRGHNAGVFHCATSATGRHIVSCGVGETRNVLVWKWPQPKVVLELEGHRRPVVYVSLSSDGAVAASSDLEGVVTVHNIARGAPSVQRTLHLGAAHAASLCREEPHLLCTAGADGSIRMLDIREQNAVQSFFRSPSTVANYTHCDTCSMTLLRAHDGRPVHAAEFVDRCTIFSGGADHKMKRWDLRLGSTLAACAAEYLGHTSTVRSVAVSADKQFMVSGCEDGSGRVWLKELEQQQLSSDGYCTAVRTLHGHVSQVSACAWQGTDNTASVLTASWDQSIRKYDIDDLKALKL